MDAAVPDATVRWKSTAGIARVALAMVRESLYAARLALIPFSEFNVPAGLTLLKLRDGRPQRSRRSSTSDTMNPNPGQPPDWIDRSNHLRDCALSPRRRYQFPRP